MTDLFENRLKRMLKAGKKTAGAWAQLCSPTSAEILCRAGFDWVLIDMEHSPADLQTLVAQLQAMGAYGVIPVVRAPWNDLVWIKRILWRHDPLREHARTGDCRGPGLQVPTGRHSRDRRESAGGGIRPGHERLPQAGQR